MKKYLTTRFALVMLFSVLVLVMASSAILLNKKQFNTNIFGVNSKVEGISDIRASVSYPVAEDVKLSDAPKTSVEEPKKEEEKKTTTQSKPAAPIGYGSQANIDPNYKEEIPKVTNLSFVKYGNNALRCSWDNDHISTYNLKIVQVRDGKILKNYNGLKDTIIQFGQYTSGTYYSVDEFNQSYLVFDEYVTCQVQAVRGDLQSEYFISQKFLSNPVKITEMLLYNTQNGQYDPFMGPSGKFGINMSQLILWDKSLGDRFEFNYYVKNNDGGIDHGKFLNLSSNWQNSINWIKGKSPSGTSDLNLKFWNSYTSPKMYEGNIIIHMNIKDSHTGLMLWDSGDIGAKVVEDPEIVPGHATWILK